VDPIGYRGRTSGASDVCILPSVLTSRGTKRAATLIAGAFVTILAAGAPADARQYPRQQPLAGEMLESCRAPV
jgi:hypothetical protein